MREALRAATAATPPAVSGRGVQKDLYSVFVGRFRGGLTIREIERDSERLREIERD